MKDQTDEMQQQEQQDQKQQQKQQQQQQKRMPFTGGNEMTTIRIFWPFS